MRQAAFNAKEGTGQDEREAEVNKGKVALQWGTVVADVIHIQNVLWITTSLNFSLNVLFEHLFHPDIEALVNANIL